MLTKKILLACFCFFAIVISHAQTFEIRTVNQGFSVIAVQVRETSDVPVTHSNFVTDMVFGIRWDTAYHVDLVPDLTTNYNIKKSGSRSQSGGFYFQAFYSDNTPYQLFEDWNQNEWIEVMSVRNTMTGIDTGTFRICENGFDPTTNPNIGIDLTDFTPAINGEANSVVLPVNLINFTVASLNNTIKLNWTTTSETNSKGFDVQRSESNASQYTSIGFINSRSSGSNYSFTDEKAATGIRYFYRLKQVDVNGHYRYSDIKDAMLNKAISALLQLSPNPAKDIINLYFSTDCITKPVSIQIIDSKGVMISSWKEIMQPGKKITYSTSNLTSGQYFLIVEDKGPVVYKISFQKIQ